MSEIVTQAPRFSETDAARVARELFALEVRAKLLPSERDQNFHIIASSGKEYVLKIANASEHLEVLEFQNQAMMHIAGKHNKTNSNDPAVPLVFETKSGEQVETVAADDGTKHFVRVLTYLPGKLLAKVKPHDASLFESLGRFFGNLDLAFEDFDHPAAHRDFHWDLQNAGKVVGNLIDKIEDPKGRHTVKNFLNRFQDETEPKLANLRKQVIHSDGNDYNIVVTPDGMWQNRVSGIIDFGDMVHSQTINDLAIVCAYVMLDKADPLTAAKHVVAGYNESNPLSEPELSALFDLICMRLCTSVCHSAHQAQLEPENEYLRISEEPAWVLLDRLADIHSNFAYYVFREACELPPVPQSQKITQWLTRQSDNLGKVLDADFKTSPPLVCDLSVGSPLLEPEIDSTGMSLLEQRIFGRMLHEKTDVAIGRYNEARLFYREDLYKSQTAEMPEYRSIHLGADLFTHSGNNVYAFMDSKVHSLNDNQGSLNYGPTIILAHQTDGGEVFYTLYGHLSPESLSGIKTGDIIRKGEAFAKIGDIKTNGGWPPHLHFQIIEDMLGNAGDFPGVAPPKERNVWTGICPDPNVILKIPDTCFPPDEMSRDKMLEIRKRKLGKNLSISYNVPLKIVRGIGQYLVSQDGKFYLDGVNNVCHVGHCHPHVVSAGQKQMIVLNTNTRYLHDNIIEYAQRLLSKFPKPLSVCMFVCSGSEANELALRMARNYTGKKDIITVDGAYHGNTQALIDISPYKHDGPGGKGAPAWVHTVTMPDGYRGPHKGLDENTGKRYADDVKDAVKKIEANREGVAAFICESMLGCGGQVILPENYMKAAFNHVRSAGGVCIADEVQVGFGRVGTHFWAFETQGVVPDIVTLGKPMGNGHPLAAVITTPAIADAFANGMEYFNTFGGNPVSCAIGMAVLDVIENEGLQENAKMVGKRLLDGLRTLEEKYPIVGDTRGLGLYVGIELVTNRRTLEPAPDHAAYIINRAKDYGILLSTDGPLHNVIKLKPPIVFTNENADSVVHVLDRILAEDCLQI